MNRKDAILLNYKNAREQVRLGEPKKARQYVLAVLNLGLEEYKASKTIITKLKNETFLRRWVDVSRDLYNVGITDYVLECFGFEKKSDKAVVPEPVENTPKMPSVQKPAGVKPKEPVASNPVEDKPQEPLSPNVSDGGIDISGILDGANEQGWGAEIFEANKSAVVQIDAITETSMVRKISNGTGFIISDKGFLLTNDHVVFDDDACSYCRNIKMTLLGTSKSYKVEVLFSDKKADVALCKFNPDKIENFSSVKMIADYSRVKPGADCLIIGNAFGMGLAPCVGIVRFTKNDDGNLVYTIPSNPGDSGSPVFNHSGEVIGINKSKTVKVNGKAADGYANATPMDTISGLLDKWTSNNDITL